MTIDRPALEPNERLIWTGRPNAFRYAQTKGLMYALFGSLWTVIAVGALGGATRSADPIGALVGFAFVAIGVGLVASPFWHLGRAMRTTYMLTDKRAVIEVAQPFGRRLSVLLSRVQFIDLRQSSNGFGDIYFKETAVPGGDGPTLNREGFVAVADAAEVERVMRRALERAPQ